MRKSKFYFIINKQNFSSFQKPIFYLMLFLLNYSCYNPPEEKWKCILNCNPDECLMLDEENCKCITDPECAYLKLCDGDIEDCGCKEEDGGSWCTALTDDSIKTWIVAFMYDSVRDEIIASNNDFYLGRTMGEIFYSYRLDNIYLAVDENIEKGDPFITSWEFDNVIYPEKIIYRYVKSKYNYPNSYYCEDRDLIKLTPDTLILSSDIYLLNGLIGYVPAK